MVQFGFGGHAVASRFLAVVSLVIEGCGDALVVWGHNSSAEHSCIVMRTFMRIRGMMLNFGDCVSLRGVLIGVPDVLDAPQLGLEHRAFLFLFGITLELLPHL